MITHYDMTTGEIIADEPAERVTVSHNMPTELRLMTVDEAVALERLQKEAQALRMPPPPVWAFHLD